MPRWVIADVIGDGSPPGRADTDATGPFRPVVADLGPFRCIIPPGSSWALVYSEADPTALSAEPRCRVLPDERLDHVLTTLQANVVNNHLAARGLVTRASAGDTVREVIESIAHELDPSFSTDWFPGAA